VVAAVAHLPLRLPVVAAVAHLPLRLPVVAAVAHLPLRLPVVAAVARLRVTRVDRVMRVEPRVEPRVDRVDRVESALKGLPLVSRGGHVRMSFDRKMSRA